MNKLTLRRILVSAVGAALILYLGSSLKDSLGSRESPVRQMSFRESVKKVETVPVVLKNREIFLSNMGKVISESAVDIITEVPGEIRSSRIALKRGQKFSSNQVLFTIDSREAKLSLFAQKSNFMTAVAGVLPELKIDYPQSYGAWQGYFESLSVEETLPPLPEIKDSQEKVFFSTRDILNQFYSIKSGEERLSKYVVRAPFSGSYIEVLQESGSVVNTGTRVARIARSNRLEIELPLRAEDLSFVKPGMEVLISETGQEGTWKGRIGRVSSIVDPTTQSINVYIQFDPKGRQVFDGQLLLVRIPGSELKEVMQIPRNAVFNRDQVYVVEDNKLKAKKINIQKLNREELLFSGLEDGELVVIEPLINAYENMAVEPQGEGETEKVARTPGAGATPAANAEENLSDKSNEKSPSSGSASGS